MRKSLFLYLSDACLPPGNCTRILRRITYRHSLRLYFRWVERLRVVGLQRGQQPGAETIQSQPSSAHRGPPGPLLSPALSDVNLHFDYGFPSPPPGPGTPWSSFASSAPPTPGMDAPSPGMSHELGGLTIGEGAEVATPKTGLQSLPEEKEEEAVEAGAKDDQKVDVANTPVPGPGQAKMDVDA